MQYLFRGLRRDVGEPLAGRVVAPNEDVAYSALEDYGIDVESLRPESVRQVNGASSARAPIFGQALEDALAEAGVRIRFDQLARQHVGQCIWVLDRDRIRRRVMQLVNEATGHDEDRQHARDLVARRLEEQFEPRQHLGDERSVETVDLEAEISRLAAAMGKMERAMASMSVSAQRGGNREQRRIVPERTVPDRSHDEVLIEIFENNLELMRATRRQGRRCR